MRASGSCRGGASTAPAGRSEHAAAACTIGLRRSTCALDGSGEHDTGAFDIGVDRSTSAIDARVRRLGVG